LYYPTLSISDKEDLVDIYATFIEEGFEEGTSTLISATVTAIINYVGSSFASNTVSFVNVGFSLSSQVVILVNYNNMKNAYNTFVSQ